MKNMFYYVKTAIREAIIQQHGTITNFIERNPGQGFTSSKISQALNPSQNVTLESLTQILDCLNLEFNIKKKVVMKAGKQARSAA